MLPNNKILRLATAKWTNNLAGESSISLLFKPDRVRRSHDSALRLYDDTFTEQPDKSEFSACSDLDICVQFSLVFRYSVGVQSWALRKALQKPYTSRKPTASATCCTVTSPVSRSSFALVIRMRLRYFFGGIP